MLVTDSASLQAFEGLLQRFAAVRVATSPATTDLHLVIVEAPSCGHPAMAQNPPIGKVRPDLARKKLLTHHQSITTSVPARRFLYYGNAQLLDLFLPLALEAAEKLCAYDSELERCIQGATWEGLLHYMPNLWADAIPSIAETYKLRGFMRRSRWSVGAPNAIAPYDEDKYQYWIEKAREQGEWIDENTSQSVNITTFTKDVFECSIVALLGIIDFIGSNSEAHHPNVDVREVQQNGQAAGTDQKPQWVEDKRTLRFGDWAREFRSNSNQVKLIEEFERNGWITLLKNPFGTHEQLRQTIKDLNKSLCSSSFPIRFSIQGVKAKWGKADSQST